MKTFTKLFGLFAACAVFIGGSVDCTPYDEYCGQNAQVKASFACFKDVKQEWAAGEMHQDFISDPNDPNNFVVLANTLVPTSNNMISVEEFKDVPDCLVVMGKEKRPQFSCGGKPAFTVKKAPGTKEDGWLLALQE
ncbi:uncharacterized protein UTRI_10236 [Ustilago trichophora]|uniref:Uncharacterized protein n=1 Tax=Ustilago trichophora TaxID=86804 RepID=A0A5C3EER7_9BASI|nr:uncharacterized protein UTRI_10236 [Ustilago trichophora]